MSNKKLDMIFSVVKTFLAILIAMVVALIIILCISDEPLTALHSFLLGPFTNIRRIGNLVENGEYHADMETLGQLVEDISYNNTVKFFGFDV